MNTLKVFSSLHQKCLTSVIRKWHDSFLSGASSQYIEDMYNAWLQDPKSVHASWNSYFKNVTHGVGHAYHPPPNLAPSDYALSNLLRQPIAGPQPKPGQYDDKTIEDHLAVQGVIRSYQARGHLMAKIDPLELDTLYGGKPPKLMPCPHNAGSPPSEILKKYKLKDMNRVYKLPQNTFIGGVEEKLPLHEILKRLEKVYCCHIGLEYIYVDNMEERQFLRERMETPGALEKTVEQKRRTLKRLIRTSEFENFLAKKWASEKRFGIEGCDMFIPGMKEIIDKSTELGVERFIIGIAHRGRLNLLANVLRKPLYQIFNQFVPLEPADLGSGDVKYHYGSHTSRLNAITQKKYDMTLLANPSHLESVNSLVLGYTRALQVHTGDDEGKKTMAIIVHGDAAFSGQGVNYESLGLSYLPNYTTRGSICIIINNQIGFTTDPRFSRSSRYCSDLGRVVNAPIFHVNAEDPENVIHVCSIAAEYRAKFHKDIIIDLVGYRKHGHNEADEPAFTQPIMYAKIAKMKSVSKRYADELIQQKVVTADEVKEIINSFTKICEEQYVEASKQTQIYIKHWVDSPWDGFYEGKDPLKATPTGIPESTLTHIAEVFSSPPPESLGFVIHKGLFRVLDGRKKLSQQRLADWSMGEAFAIGSLVKDGTPVRLSGEDVERGTFSHRHHVLHHQTNDKVTYKPLGNLYSNQAQYVVCNSSLSEFGVLGFETGYAQANPNCLVIWEAQFGDFFNTAQCIFDQFLCSGETKWGRQNGLVVLLPHGYEGMGSEHSSGRPERFLQLCDDDPDAVPDLSPDFAMRQLRDCNWIVANCSTPANLFHVLRRQILLPFRKPLMLFTPKSLLRLPECRSSFDEMREGTEFRRGIPEEGEASKQPEKVKKLMFCTGKIYYDIMANIKKSKLEKEIAVTRIEQISPFPYDVVKADCDKYKNARLVWAQEETKNGGAYAYALDRMNALLKRQREISYIGRPPGASPATGAKAQHIKEVQMLAQEFVRL